MSFDLLDNIDNSKLLQYLNKNTIKSLLKGLSESSNEERNKSEHLFFSLKFHKQLYIILFDILTDASENQYYKIQSIITMKNLVKTELNTNRSKFRILDEENPDIKEITDYIKVNLIKVIAEIPSILQNINNIKELIKILADKYFPDNWEYLFFLLEKVFSLELSEVFNNLGLVIGVVKIFYSILKQHGSKKIPSSRAKYLKIKTSLNELIMVFYNNISAYYINNLQNIQEEKLLFDFLELIRISDKTLILMIEAGFHISDFCKDENMINMFTVAMNKTDYTLQQLIQYTSQFGKNAKIVEVLTKTFNKNMELLSRILCNPTAQLIYFSNLEKYIRIITFVLSEHKLFTQDTIKIILYSLHKLVSVDYFKDPNKNFYNSGTKITNKQRDIFSTPDKRTALNNNISNNSNGYNLVSPIKFKNYEKEVKIASEVFSVNFNENTIISLFNILVNDIPLCFNTHNDTNEATEIENNIDKEDESLGTLEIYDRNNISYYVVYRSCIESMLINFRDILIDYFTNSVFESTISLIKNKQIDITQNKNISFINSIILVINLFPKLYQNEKISQVQMIDYKKYFDILEILIHSNHIYISSYLSAIDKWTNVLVSCDVIHLYINNISIFLKNLNDKTILIEACLALENIINKIDNYLNENKNVMFNLSTDAESLIKKIKENINWSDFLIIVSKICFEVLVHDDQSAEIISQLVKLLTLLIEKCHFQCDGAILSLIKNSKLKEIIVNCNDLTRNNFNEMFKVLLYAFPSSSVIINLALMFIENAINKKIDMYNINMLLFLLKTINIEEYQASNHNNLNVNGYEEYLEISNCLEKIVNISLDLLKSFTFNYSNHLIFQLIDELILLNVLSSNSQYLILVILQERLTNIQKISIDNIKKMDKIDSEEYSYISYSNGKRFSFSNNASSSLVSNNNNNQSLTFTNNEICEYKTSLLNTFYTFILKFNTIKAFDNMIIDNIFYEVVVCLFSDIDIQSSFFTTSYNSALIGLLNRICCCDFNHFMNILSEYIQNNGVDFSSFLKKWLLKMENIISNEIRRVNIITVCLILPNLNKDIFLYVRHEIFQICLSLIHAELIKKILENKINNPNQNSHSIDFKRGSIKTMLIQMSVRKRVIHKTDSLQFIDIHDLFVKQFSEAIKIYGLDINFIIDQLVENSGISSRLSEILGLKKIEDHIIS